MTILLTLIGFLTLSPAVDRPPADQTWNVAGFRIESGYENTGDRRLTILKDGQEVYAKTVGQYWFVEVHHGKPSTSVHNPVVADVTGDGVPELVIEEFPRNSQCCWNYTVVSLGKSPKEVASVGGFPSPMTFEDINGDGVYEITGDDWNFNSWYAGSRLILGYHKGAYRLASHLMKRPAPTEAELAAKAVEFRKSAVYADFPVARDVYQYMIDLVYSGNMDSALAFLDLSWPKQSSTDGYNKKDFIDRFKQQLAKSPYWTEIAEMSAPSRTSN
jgi:hypothetical protein